MATRKALIVGAGGMGKAWGRNLLGHPDTEIAGWVDISGEALDKAEQELETHIPYKGTELEAALQQTHPDFVVDVTPPEVHCEVTVQSLMAGYPVLGEKPMASSMKDARAMVAAAISSGQLYMVSQSRRYHNKLRAFRELVSGNIGELGLLNADFFIGPHFGGFREEMAHPLLLDMAIHTFDAARFVSGLDPVSVYAEAFNMPGSWFKGNASAVVIFEMERGVRFTYRGSWSAEGFATSWESDWRAVGSRGSVVWNGHDDPAAEVAVATHGFMSDHERQGTEIPNGPAGIAGSLQDFLNALETGRTPMGECQDNIESLAMVFGAIESAQTGRRVGISDLI